jgi:hypothetical protein
VLFLEIKHWKSDKKRFSTLAWTAAPLEKLVDFGPTAARVGGAAAAACRVACSVVTGQLGKVIDITWTYHAAPAPTPPM